MTDVLISLVLVSSLDRILGRFKMFPWNDTVHYKSKYNNFKFTTVPPSGLKTETTLATEFPPQKHSW